MTYEEAIDELRNIRPRGGIIPQRRAEAIDVSISALEKQIPAEVFYDEVAEVDAIRCPTCGTLVDEYYCEEFCWHCGQRLLWNKWWWKNE